MTAPTTRSKAQLKLDPRWPELRCQVCHGLGLVAAGQTYRQVDADGTVNGTPYGEALCRACGGSGIGAQS